jgi:hypothetical protein
MALLPVDTNLIWLTNAVPNVFGLLLAVTVVG